MKNTGIKEAIYVMSNGKVTLTEENVRNYFRENANIDIAVYDKSYLDESGKAQRYLPEDLFIMIPEGDLGNTWFGTTPEESDLMSGSAANVEITDTGVAVTTMKKTDPVTVETKATMICLPDFPTADQVYIFDVLAD